MRERRLVQDAVAALHALLPALQDKDLTFKITRLIGELEVTRTFKAHGNYTNAKYLAIYLEKHIAELRSNEPGLPGLREPLYLAERFTAMTLSLPNTVSIIDPSAAVAARRATETFRSPGPYAERYPVGSFVDVAPIETLTEFMRTWKYHHKLLLEQLRFAGKRLKVRSVGYYHGGDSVYELEGAEEYRWLEPCLRPVRD
jgi:hypothetical protein